MQVPLIRGAQSGRSAFAELVGVGSDAGITSDLQHVDSMRIKKVD